MNIFAKKITANWLLGVIPFFGEFRFGIVYLKKGIPYATRLFIRVYVRFTNFAGWQMYMTKKPEAII